MIGALQRGLDRLRGTGAASVTVPSMDGALRPNTLLETATVLAGITAPDNLASDGSHIYLSSGGSLLRLTPQQSEAQEVGQFAAPIACLAGHASGLLAVGLDDGRLLLRGGAQDGRAFTALAGEPLRCPTALAFADPQTLFVCLGSRSTAPLAWKRDLMERNASGSVWRLDLASGAATCLGERLAYPCGVSPGPAGEVVVAEAWRHRLIALAAGRAPRVVIGDLPGYPSRLAPAADGGHWLCIFAPRRQMIEFVLREPAYRQRTLRELPEDLWMAPALCSGRSFQEPLQGGAVKHLGIDKPWAPSRSYGLLVRLSAAYGPIASAHSRADGQRHGITSALTAGAHVLTTSKGGDLLLRLDTAALDGE